MLKGLFPILYNRVISLFQSDISFVEDGLEYFFQGPTIRRVLSGGFMFLFSLSFVPLFFVLGYFLQVITSTMLGEDVPPELNRSWMSFKAGTSVFIILVVYLGLFVGSVYVVTSAVSLTIFSDVSLGINQIGLLYMINSSFGVILSSYFLPVALVVYSQTRSIKRALNLGEVASISYQLQSHFHVFLLSIVQLGMVVFSVYLIFQMTSYIALFLYPFVFFSHCLIVSRWYGHLGKYMLQDIDPQHLAFEAFKKYDEESGNQL